MAGGKETPRQKMIGMMYLVLTALLALNVSKSILDAFVAIEENTQKTNIVQVERGNEFYSDVAGEYATTPNDAENKAKKAKLKQVMDQMLLIDKEAGEMIEKIDKIKLLILDKSGENVTVKPKDEGSIVWTKYDASKDRVLPARMHLMAVQAKDQYDVPMHEIIGEDIKSPNGVGKQLWTDLINYRKKIVELTGTYSWGENSKFSISPTSINMYKDNQELTKKVRAMIAKSNSNHKEDDAVLEQLYIGLTKLEKTEVHGIDGVHWIGGTFDHAPLVAALASLSSMQQDVLAARAMALAHWKSKVSTGEYSFNKITALAYGPAVVNSGDTVKLKVMMAAFDSDNQPKVTIAQEGGKVEYPGDGTGLVTIMAGNSEIELSGTVAIKNKSGVPKTEPWKHRVIVMKPSGAIELPEMNVLYRGYPNKAEATASGYDQTVLTGSGASVSKSGDGYIVKPIGRGREAYLMVSGKNTATGQTTQLKKVKYRCVNLPDPELYWGGSKSGEKGNRRETKLFAKYPPEIPLNATFKIINWECTIPGAPGAPPRGSGGNVSSASSLILQARPGMMVSFLCTVVGPDGIQRKKAGAFKL